MVHHHFFHPVLVGRFAFHDVLMSAFLIPCAGRALGDFTQGSNAVLVLEYMPSDLAKVCVMGIDKRTVYLIYRFPFWLEYVPTDLEHLSFERNRPNSLGYHVLHFPLCLAC